MLYDKEINNKIYELKHITDNLDFKLKVITCPFGLPSNPKKGEIYILETGEEYIYTEEAYEKIGNFKNIEYSEYNEPKVEYTPKARFCTCCGAPLHGLICAYCGVEYK